jgi:hypothetical protein
LGDRSVCHQEIVIKLRGASRVRKRKGQGRNERYKLGFERSGVGTNALKGGANPGRSLTMEADASISI